MEAHGRICGLACIDIFGSAALDSPTARDNVNTTVIAAFAPVEVSRAMQRTCKYCASPRKM